MITNGARDKRCILICISIDVQEVGRGITSAFSFVYGGTRVP